MTSKRKEILTSRQRTAGQGVDNVMDKVNDEPNN
jgi:hypothetical protein